MGKTLRFDDFIKSFEFDYENIENTLPEKAWVEIENSYTAHLNAAKQKTSDETVKVYQQNWNVGLLLSLICKFVPVYYS